MDVFACMHCSAIPEPLVDGNLVVRHAPHCEVLIAQTQPRWPLKVLAYHR